MPDRTPAGEVTGEVLARLRAECLALKRGGHFSPAVTNDEVLALLDAFEAQRSLLSRPYVGAWLDEVLVEAAHQRQRWGSEHDVGKSALDWFWLIGFLAQKAAYAQLAGDDEKARHHTVSTAAALAQWAAQISGEESVMRPGIGPEGLLDALRSRCETGGGA